MRKYVLTGFLFLIFTVGAKAQTGCPSDMVCITKPAAQHFLQVDDENKALKAENTTLQNSFNVVKEENTTLKIELAKASTKATELEVQRTRDTAMIELLVKMVRPKKVGLINLF